MRAERSLAVQVKMMMMSLPSAFNSSIVEAVPAPGHEYPEAMNFVRNLALEWYDLVILQRLTWGA